MVSAKQAEKYDGGYHLVILNSCEPYAGKINYNSQDGEIVIERAIPLRNLIDKLEAMEGTGVSRTQIIEDLMETEGSSKTASLDEVFAIGL